MTTTKFLIETLTDVPDLQLLKELFAQIKKHDSLVISDVRKLFAMMSNLYMSKNQPIVIKTLQLNQHINKILLKTQIQISWQHIGKSLVLLCGQQNDQIRKRARNIVLEIMDLTKNSFMILEKLYYEGLEDQSIIIQVYSIKLIFKVLELTTNILSKQSNISIIKFIMQKIIRLTSSNHTDISKNANHFLHRLFFLKIEKMDEVLQRLDPYYSKMLQKLWEKSKQNMLFKQLQDQQSQEFKALKEIKYQHLPMINDKFFGVYEPFVIKNLFNPETQAAKKFSITQFKQLFLQNTQRLTKYANSICKIIQRLLPDRSQQILELLDHIITLPGITNIINVNDLLSELISQLQSENVPYRRQLREILKKLNYLPNIQQIIIKKYQQALENEGQQILNWLKIYEILCLIQHWTQNADALLCYPPTLNFAVRYISLNLKHKVVKVRDQCIKLLYFILQKFSGYRQNLDEYFDPKMVGQFEDILEKKRIQTLPENQNQKIKQSKQTFLKEFNQQRLRFLKIKKK